MMASGDYLFGSLIFHRRSPRRAALQIRFNIQDEHFRYGLENRDFLPGNEILPDNHRLHRYSPIGGLGTPWNRIKRLSHGLVAPHLDTVELSGSIFVVKQGGSSPGSPACSS
jgi:hypothetical protein